MQHPKEPLPPETIFGKIAQTISEVDNLATRGYWALPSGASPALEHTGQPSIISRALSDPSTMDECRVSNRYDDVSVPSLNIAGWYDVFLQGSIDNYVEMRKRGQTARLVVGPWSHVSLFSTAVGFVGDVNFGISSVAVNGRTLTDLQLDWYDHWLGDEPATSLHESGVALFVMGANTWRMEPDWPLERQQETPLFLGANRSLAWEPATAEVTASSYIYDPLTPTPTCGGALVMSGEFRPGPVDQATVEARSDVLTFTTQALNESLEVTGRVRAILHAASDAPSTDWVVRLCDVDEHGVSRNVTDGVIRIEMTPSVVTEVELDLWSTSYVFKAGHRIRVQVTSSNFPRWDRNPNTGQPAYEATEFVPAEQRVYHGGEHPSRLILPVIPSIG